MHKCDICNYSVHEDDMTTTSTDYLVCDDGDCAEIAEQLPSRKNLPQELTTYVVDCENGWRQHGAMVVVHKGSIMDVQRDGYEPEDVRFYRSLSWIPSMIEQAYKLGLKDGQND